MTIQIKAFTAVSNGNIIEVAVEMTQGEHSEKRFLKVLSSDFISMRLSKGEISPELFDELERAEKRGEAYLRALNIVSFGANTAKGLIIKLRRRGIEEDAAREAVNMLLEKGYLNEEKDLNREIKRCIRKKWGRNRIVAHLHSKGYEDEVISEADDAFSEVDFPELCLELICDKCDEIPKDPKEKQKLIASLARYGYSMSEIKYAFSKFGK